MKKIIKFILLTFAFSWGLWGLQILGQNGVLPEWFQAFGMLGLFGPLFALIVITKIEKKSLKETFKNMFSKAPVWTIIFAVISPMILSGTAYLIYVATADNAEPLGVTLVTFLPIAFMILFVGGPVEEFGWRGYLLPKLRDKYSIIITILIMGIIHGIWHIPLHYINGTVQEAIPIYEFLIVTIAITVSYVFIYEYTKSIIPMIILHWFANYSSAIFPYFYSSQGRYALLIFTIILDIILISALHKKGKLKPASE